MIKTLLLDFKNKVEKYITDKRYTTNTKHTGSKIKRLSRQILDKSRVKISGFPILIKN